jgi:hypothetical protein
MMKYDGHSGHVEGISEHTQYIRYYGPDSNNRPSCYTILFVSYVTKAPINICCVDRLSN